jgi:glutathione S-transferase
MVQLVDADIKTREVLDWKGVHIFHFFLSSCSQKLRIFLNLKAIDWEPHPIDLSKSENLTDWFLGINPRGLLPVLVHDGTVHIESNDIITYLDAAFPADKLIPEGHEGEVAALLKHEDDLHMDLRGLSFRFVFAPPGPPKPPEALETYASAGTATVQGKDDRAAVDRQIAFWKAYAEQGYTDEAVRRSAQTFRRTFDELDERLAGQPYMLGDKLTVLDIAWFIYVNRLVLAGYPLARLHPRLAAWFADLTMRPEFAKEIALPPPVEQAFAATRRAHEQAGQSLEAVAGF